MKIYPLVKNVADCMLEVLTGLFNNESYSNNNTEDYYEQTYNYWINLDYDSQEYYFKSNEYLRNYIKNDYYPNDRELTARHVAHIAQQLNRNFTTIYNSRY